MPLLKEQGFIPPGERDVQHQRTIEPRTLLGSQDLSPYIKGAKVVSLKLYSLDVPTRNIRRICKCVTLKKKVPSQILVNVGIGKEVVVGICSHNI